ncbi:hypothetical protein D3C75_698430 [compost metagenome]
MRIRNAVEGTTYTQQKIHTIFLTDHACEKLFCLVLLVRGWSYLDYMAEGNPFCAADILPD